MVVQNKSEELLYSCSMSRQKVKNACYEEGGCKTGIQKLISSVRCDPMGHVEVSFVQESYVLANYRERQTNPK